MLVMEKKSLKRECATMVMILIAYLFIFKDPYTNHSLLWGVRKRGRDVCGASAYTIVIDAGSTGSRIHVYEFQKCQQKLENNTLPEYHLVDELFAEVKPGLSSYAHRPELAALSLLPLIQKAKLRVPRIQYAKTLLSIRATAGLRLLEEYQVRGILEAIKHQLAKEPFKLVDVKVIDGEEEAYLAWKTVRFLQKEDGIGAAVMDLGGASTQVVFALDNETNNKDLSNDHRFMKTKLKGREISIFKRSYLGYGLMEVRKKVKSSFTQSSGKNNTEKFPCLKRDGGNFEKCSKLIRNALFDSKAEFNEMPKIAPNRAVVAFSYFYDRTIPLGLKSPITPKQIELVGRRLCLGEYDSEQIENEWCLDLAYLHGLLTNGYKLGDDHLVNVVKQIKGWETGWALGSALELLNI
jgi:guanosine-diphosphatase